MLKRCWRFLHSDEGATAVEYAVMLALILMICFVAIQTLGTTTQTVWQNNNTSLQTAGLGGGS